MRSLGLTGSFMELVCSLHIQPFLHLMGSTVSGTDFKEDFYLSSLSHIQAELWAKALPSVN